MASIQADKNFDEKQLKNSYEKIWSQGELCEEASYYQGILDFLEVQKGKRLLDVACGAGHLLYEAEQKNLETYGIDISDSAISRAMKRCKNSNIVQGVAERLPFPDKYFDYVTCLGSLEHFLDPAQALRDMERVLKDDGSVCIVLPNQWFIPDVIRGLVDGEGLTHGQEVETFFSLKEAIGLLERDKIFKVSKKTKYNPPVEAIRVAKKLTKWNTLMILPYRLFRNRLPLTGSYVFIFLCVKYVSTVPSFLKVGSDGSEEYLLHGWHIAEAGPPPFRWTKKEASVYLKVPLNSSLIRLKVRAGQPDLGRVPPKGEVFIDDILAGRFSLATTDWENLSFDVPSSANNHLSQVKIVVDRCWVPDKTHGSGDNRELGVAVEEIGFEEK